MMTRLFLHFATRATLALALAACGSDGQSPSPDAPSGSTDAARPDGPTIDAPPGVAATVVDCAGVTPAAEVFYTGDTLTQPASPIAVGQVVRFRDLGSHTAWHVDGLWSASGGETQCVRFDGAGAYGFYCYFHQDPDESGTIVVQ